MLQGLGLRCSKGDVESLSGLFTAGIFGAKAGEQVLPEVGQAEDSLHTLRLGQSNPRHHSGVCKTLAVSQEVLET